MILIDLFKIIIIFPFVIDWLLGLKNMSRKQRSFMLSPLYLVTMFVLLCYIFQLIPGIVIGFICLIAFVLYVFFLVRKKYRKVYVQYVVRTFLNEFYIIFQKIYILLVVVGILYKGVSGEF